MVNTISNTFTADPNDSSSLWRLVFVAALLLVVALLPVEAWAQTTVSIGGAGGGAGGGNASVAGFCAIAEWFKLIVGAVALIAGIMYVINSFFAKSNVMGDIVITVLMGCIIATALGWLIGLALGTGTQCPRIA